MYFEDLQYCEKYITYCTDIPISSDVDCPDAAPIFNSIEKICTDMDCPEEGFENGTCIIKKEKYKVRKFFIYWFNDTYIQFPSFNIDKSGYLLVEFSIADNFRIHQLHNKNFPKRKLFFLDEDGRGLFDKYKDISEKIITYDTNSYRFLSVSLAVKVNNESEYSYLLNYEQSQGLLELINIKTGKASYKYINTLLKGYRNIIFEESFLHNAQIFLIELNEDNNNTYLLGFLEKETLSLNIKKGLTLVKFNFTSIDDNIDINSLTIIYFFHLSFDIGDSRISVVEGKNNNFFFEYLNMESYIEVIAYNIDTKHENIPNLGGFKLDIQLIQNFYHKLSLLKKEEEEEVVLFYSDYYNYNFLIYKFINNQFNLNISISFKHDYFEGYLFQSIDMIVFNENRIIVLSHKFHGKTIIITILDFLGSYTKFFKTKYSINIINEKIHLLTRFSLMFKYKDILGFHLNNIKGMHGFVFFGYFNSTDPRQIYNLKKDGLNYSIKLNQYLQSQSHIFG